MATAKRRTKLTITAAAAAAAFLAIASTTAAAASGPTAQQDSAPVTGGVDGNRQSDDRQSDYRDGGRPVHISVFAPERHDNAGVEGRGWFVDMELDFPGGPDGLRQSGFTAFQLTGPAVHANAAPFPGSFSTGHDDRNPGLVVLTSTTNSGTPGFSGPGTNLANLFNLTGVTNRTADETEIWDTWLIGAAFAGKDIDTTLTVAEIADINHNGIFDDAPDVIDDLNHDGTISGKDLRVLGVASNIVTVAFHLNGAPA